MYSLTLTFAKVKPFTHSYVVYFSTHSSEGETSTHSYTWLAVIVKGWVSFLSCEGNPLINGNPKVAYFSTHFSESESFHGRTLGYESSLKDGSHFIHGRGTPLSTETLKLHTLARTLYTSALTFQKVKLLHSRTLG